MSQLIEDKKTIICVDGIAYPFNAATVIRNASILGADCIIFSPIDNERYESLDEQAKRYFNKSGS